MPPASDHRLTDPTAAAVRDTLRRACATANGRRKTGSVNLNDAAAKTIAGRVATTPEGHYHATGTHSRTDTARLGVAWWTAPGGRKLVRVRSRREPCQEYQTDYDHPARVAHRALAARPPVWHLDPERMTMAEADGETHCVAVCGCGAAGSPESLAWAHGMCGPCRDRVEEHGPDAVSHEPGVLTDANFRPEKVAFTADGLRVVAVGGNAYRVWDRATGSVLAAGGGTARNPFNVVTADGRFVFLVGNGHVSYHDLVTGRQLAWPDLDCPDVVAVTGRPGELLVQHVRWYSALPFRLVSFGDGSHGPRVSPGFAAPMPQAVLQAVHPDGPRAVFADGGRVAVCRVGRPGDFETIHEFRLGTGQHDRTGNWTGGPKLVRFTADGERLLFVSDGTPDENLELWAPARKKALVQTTFPAAIRDAHFSPDGEHLFVLAADGAVFVCHPGLLTHVRARLSWHAGAAYALAVSPDGRTLATAGAGGVRVWPVARLLEVL